MTAPAPEDEAASSKAVARLTRAAFAAYVTAILVVCVWQHRVLFAWPAGIVTGNLIASAIWAPLAVIHLDKLARRHHQAHMALVRKHHRDQLQLADYHHQVHMAVVKGEPEPERPAGLPELTKAA